MTRREKRLLAYLVGVALGDGNLSNPNGRAIRLRITCDARYPAICNEIIDALSTLLPQNKISKVSRKPTYYDISIYSNRLRDLIPWEVGKGTKLVQKPSVPQWVLQKNIFMIPCLRGLLQTDGSIYTDRGYRMINFTNHIHALALDVYNMMYALGYKPKFYAVRLNNSNTRYTVRLARDTESFLQLTRLEKI